MGTGAGNVPVVVGLQHVCPAAGHVPVAGARFKLAEQPVVAVVHKFPGVVVHVSPAIGVDVGVADGFIVGVGVGAIYPQLVLWYPAASYQQPLVPHRLLAYHVPVTQVPPVPPALVLHEPVLILTHFE